MFGYINEGHEPEKNKKVSRCIPSHMSSPPI
jgi:hypothetical protein